MSKMKEKWREKTAMTALAIKPLYISKLGAAQHAGALLMACRVKAKHKTMIEAMSVRRNEVSGSTRLVGSYRASRTQERETTSGSGHDPRREESAVMVLCFNV